MATQPEIELIYRDGSWFASFGDSNVFGPEAGNTYPVPGRPYAPEYNFGVIANDLLRRYPAARVWSA